jgi:hypothetical protein
LSQDDQARALSFSIVYHATQWFPVVLVGFLFLMKEQLSLAQVGRISSRKDLVDVEGSDPSAAADSVDPGSGGGPPEDGRPGACLKVSGRQRFRELP